MIFQFNNSTGNGSRVVHAMRSGQDPRVANHGA